VGKINRGKRLMRKRGELIERSFAHGYETGAMRRTHLKRHDNIAKRLLIHIGGFNLSLVMRKLTGAGKPRRLQGRCSLAFGLFRAVWNALATAARKNAGSNLATGFSAPRAAAA
jgi:transposase